MSATTPALVTPKELADLRSAKIALPIEQRRHAKARRRIHELEREIERLRDARAAVIEECAVWLRDHELRPATAENLRRALANRSALPKDQT